MKGRYRPIPAREVLAEVPAARRDRIEARGAELIAEEMALRDLRRSRRITQEQVAERLGGRQVYVSRFERRSDMKVSTLRDYVRAIGGELELIVSFPEGGATRLNAIGEERPIRRVAAHRKNAADRRKRVE